jgi:hypothetical protein
VPGQQRGGASEHWLLLTVAEISDFYWHLERSVVGNLNLDFGQPGQAIVTESAR